MKRTPQAQRSAATRSKVIGATIKSLYEAGYARTTIAKVAKAAKVSNGAMVHQFPSKEDLMIAVVETAYEDFTRNFQMLEASMSAVEVMHAMLDMLWDLISGKEGIAITEILLASRSNPPLAKKLRAITEASDVRTYELVQHAMEGAGLERNAKTDAAHKMIVAAFRGLAIDALFQRNNKKPTEVMEVFSEMYANSFAPP